MKCPLLLSVVVLGVACLADVPESDQPKNSAIGLDQPCSPDGEACEGDLQCTGATESGFTCRPAPCFGDSCGDPAIAPECMLNSDCEQGFYCRAQAGTCGEPGRCEPIPSRAPCSAVEVVYCDCQGNTQSVSNSCIWDRIAYLGQCADPIDGAQTICDGTVCEPTQLCRPISAEESRCTSERGDDGELCHYLPLRSGNLGDAECKEGLVCMAAPEVGNEGVGRCGPRLGSASS